MLSENPAELFPHFSPTENSPPVPEALGEIVLAAERPYLSAAGPTWPLRGSFRVPNAGGENEDVLHRVVLAVTSGASYVTRARHAFREAVLFDGDVTASATDVAGYFNANLADLFDFRNRQETFHLVASIGTCTAPLLTCEVEFPWLAPPRAEPAEPGDDGGRGAEPELEEEEEPEEEEDDSWLVDEDPGVLG